jgi:hypothetical protein
VIVSVDGGATWMSSTVNQFDRPLNQLILWIYRNFIRVK